MIDFEHGEVIRNCKGPLNKHMGHGSDKFKQKNKNFVIVSAVYNFLNK